MARPLGVVSQLPAVPRQLWELAYRPPLSSPPPPTLGGRIRVPRGAEPRVAAVTTGSQRGRSSNGLGALCSSKEKM